MQGFTQHLLLILVYGLFLDQASAWSHLSSSSSSSSFCDRKTFLRDSTSCLIGAAALVGANLVTSFPAVAAAADAIATSPSKHILDNIVYEVTPGSLRDKVILITGASAGLGLESAKRLAVGGATLVLTTRSKEKNQFTLQQVQEYLQERGHHPNHNLYALELDLALDGFQGPANQDTYTQA